MSKTKNCFSFFKKADKYKRVNWCKLRQLCREGRNNRNDQATKNLSENRIIKCRAKKSERNDDAWPIPDKIEQAKGKKWMDIRNTYTDWEIEDLKRRLKDLWDCGS